MTMIERVARALIDADPHVHGHCAEHIQMKLGAARAAITALRTPSEAMLIAARDWSYAKYGKPIGDDAAMGCWQAMIDAALVEKP